MSKTLDEIGIQYGTDKTSNGHNYCVMYEKYIGHLRDKPCKVFEIGVCSGKSLLMWYGYFSQAKIIGLDIQDLFELNPEYRDRISLVKGDQADIDVLNEIQLKYGPFDLIVDDGSHVWDKTIISFETLFPTLNPGGIYVIEDLETSYEPLAVDYKGGDVSTVDCLKVLVDGVNRSLYGVKSIHFHKNICFILK
jgi:cephalosporin hydroxylase